MLDDANIVLFSKTQNDSIIFLSNPIQLSALNSLVYPEKIATFVTNKKYIIIL